MDWLPAWNSTPFTHWFYNYGGACSTSLMTFNSGEALQLPVELIFHPADTFCTCCEVQLDDPAAAASNKEGGRKTSVFLGDLLPNFDALGSPKNDHRRGSAAKLMEKFCCMTSQQLGPPQLQVDKDNKLCNQNKSRSLSTGSAGGRILTTLGAGDYFGETGLLLAIPRTSTVVAREKSLLVACERIAFHNFLLVAPGVREVLMAGMVQRLLAGFRHVQLPYLRPFKEHQMAQVASLCTLHEHKAGAVVCEAGQQRPALQIVVYGTLLLRVPRPGGGGPEGAGDEGGGGSSGGSGGSGGALAGHPRQACEASAAVAAAVAPGGGGCDARLAFALSAALDAQWARAEARRRAACEHPPDGVAHRTGTGWGPGAGRAFARGAWVCRRNFPALRRRYLPRRGVKDLVEHFYSDFKPSRRYRPWKARPHLLVGRRVRKDFGPPDAQGRGGGTWDGTVTQHFPASQTADGRELFHIEYDDGDVEDLYRNELDNLLLPREPTPEEARQIRSKAHSFEDLPAAAAAAEEGSDGEEEEIHGGTPAVF